MEWLNRLHGTTVGLDTAPLIYFIEEHPLYIEAVSLFFEAAERDEFRVVTSSVTLLEVLVQPLRANNTALVEEYRDILLNSKLIMTEISTTIAEQASMLRARHSIRTPDAIQVAAALDAGAIHFFTNDIRLPRIPGIEIITLDAPQRRNG